jgi:Cof subfamily protein (haloacid dehalogenase superfamily)
MMSLNYKMLVSDLDGTLVPYGFDDLSDKTKVQVRTLSQNNIIFTVATGRSWRQTKPVVSELGIIAPVIIQTGALVIDPVTEKAVFTQLIHPRIHHKLQYLSKEFAVDHLVLKEDCLFYTNVISSPCRDWLLKAGEQCNVVDYSLDTAAVVKHVFIGTETEMKQVIDRVQHLIDPNPNCILWPPDLYTENWLLEIFDPRASKGQAVQWLSGKLGIESGDVIAFGDSYNDLDMIEWAGTGVAVVTSPDILKEAAAQLIAGPEEEGVAGFIEGWLRAEEEAG